MKLKKISLKRLFKDNKDEIMDKEAEQKVEQTQISQNAEMKERGGNQESTIEEVRETAAPNLNIPHDDVVGESSEDESALSHSHSLVEEKDDYQNYSIDSAEQELANIREETIGRIRNNEDVSEAVGGPQDNDEIESSSNIRKAIKFPPKNARAVFLEQLPQKIPMFSKKLKDMLQGQVMFEILPSGERFFITTKGEDISVSEEETKEENSCKITLSEKDLLKILRFEINPQIGMLSHKIKIEGPSSLALYAFNLLIDER